MYWRITYRRINGVRRKVKVARKPNGGEYVRIVGKRNYSDKTRVRGRK